MDKHYKEFTEIYYQKLNGKELKMKCLKNQETSSIPEMIL